MDYTRATARNLSPLAKFAAIIPGSPTPAVPDRSVGIALAKRKENHDTNARRNLRENRGVDLSFIVMLDDLDRLEPAQAVEVIRLVKSVADFPRFRYLLCYDKAVLSEAIRRDLV